jgi:hypothetical protein
MKWLLRLYPKTWRRRYEAEFLALLEEESPKEESPISLSERLDVVRGGLDARIHLRKAPDAGDRGPRHWIRGRAAIAGTGSMFSNAFGGEGVIMRRKPLALVFLVLGVGVGLLVPYARQVVAAPFSSAESRYTGNVYRDMIGPGAARGIGLETTDVVNTGRDMPHFVAVVTAHGTIAPIAFEGQRDHRAVVLHWLHLGHGSVAYDLGPLAHGQMATFRMWYAASGHDVTDAQPAFYGQIPHLGGFDQKAAIWQP